MFIDEPPESSSPQKLKHKGHKEGEQVAPGCDAEIETSFTYHQMELHIADITPEFEHEVSKRISSQVRIFQASPDDCERVCVLHNRAFLTARDPYCPITYEDMMQVLTYRDNVVLIGTIWGEDAGFIILGFDYYPSFNPANKSCQVPNGVAPAPIVDGKPLYNVGYISGLGVDPRWQRRGVGTTLGITSWKYFKARNLIKLKCEVFEHNEASYNLISSLGFRKIGQKEYSIEQQHAEPLRRL